MTGNPLVSVLANVATEPEILLTDPAGQLAILLAVLAAIFWAAGHPIFGKLFRVVPALVFCYFVPALLSTFHVIPAESALYSWIKDFVLPASLVLLILSLDLPGIIRLGPKAIIMLLAGTAGIVIGGPISLLICNAILPGGMGLPEDIWQGMAALAGSWIGGGANFVAMSQIAGTTDDMLGAMVIVDVFAASLWMGTLFYLAGHQHRIDKWTRADASSIRALEARMTYIQEQTRRVAGVPDYMLMLAIGFGGAWLAYKFSNDIDDALELRWPALAQNFGATTWKYILVTSGGLALSFSPARKLEGAGASRIGTVMIYLLVACIGAGGDFTKVGDAPGMIIMGLIWITIHVAIMLGVGYLIKAPIFFVAVGSQSNIGGAASAPVVASAFHPSLAPVGALLAVAGYVLGTYAGLICMKLLQLAAGV